MINPIVTSSTAATWAMLRKRQELSTTIEDITDKFEGVTLKGVGVAREMRRLRLLVGLCPTRSDELGMKEGGSAHIPVLSENCRAVKWLSTAAVMAVVPLGRGSQPIAIGRKG
jgi:hypothetical protein